VLATAWVDRRRHHHTRSECRLAASISDLWPNAVFERTRPGMASTWRLSCTHGHDPVWLKNSAECHAASR
jgi:hypothetical protein